MKKEAMKIFGLSLASSSLLMNIVSAADTAQIAADTGRGISSTIAGFFSGVFGGLEPYLSVLFQNYAWGTRTLLGILLFMVIYSIVDTIFNGVSGTGGKSRIFTIIGSLIITILSFMFLPANFLEAIALQYGAMGAAILTIIPFLIMLVFTIRVKDLLVARVLWIFYSIYYFALYIYKLSQSPLSATGETFFYWVAIIAGIAVLILLPYIRDLIFRGELSAIEESGNRIAENAKLLHTLQNTELTKVYGAKK